MMASAPNTKSQEQSPTLMLNLRTRTELFRGSGDWTSVTVARSFPTEGALLLCDVWDRHWCRGACERLEAMVGRMNAVVEAARSRGLMIVHAPSETMEFYADHPARRGVQELPVVPLPTPLELPDPPLPIDASDGGSDTGETSWYKAWTRQHPAIGIEERDAILDTGQEVYNLFHALGIRNVLILGVHTNMCVLNRSFAIKNLVRWRFNTALVRDLTDTMYNPAMPPFVSHERGTELVVEHIEQHWCPTLLSEDLLRA